MKEGVWIPCEMCEDHFCVEHMKHAHDCECPSIEEWVAAGLNPYRSECDQAPNDQG